VVGVMAGMGLLGGWFNSFVGTENGPVQDLRKALLSGLVAALLIPLFLNTLSSTLVNDLLDGRPDSRWIPKLLILAGFCVLAASSSRSFIQSLSKQVLEAVHEAKEQTRADMHQAKRYAEQTEAVAEAARDATQYKVVETGKPADDAAARFADPMVPGTAP